MKTQLRNDKRGRIVAIGRIRVGFIEKVRLKLKLRVSRILQGWHFEN